VRKNFSLAEARRIALAAQGFDQSRPSAEVKARQIGRVINRLGALQLDYVNVLIPAHLLVIYSRLGPYDRAVFHEVVYGDRDYIEHWAHEACIVPARYWPELKYRRDDYQPYPNSPVTKLRNKTKYLSEIYDFIEKNAPLTSGDLPPAKAPKKKPGEWYRSLPRRAIDYHFGQGSVAVANRLPNFQRLYDLPERLIEPEHLERTVTRDEAHRTLLKQAATSFGIATADDLVDYYRMNSKEARTHIAELVVEGALREVTVEGWEKTAYIAHGARQPKKLQASALLSPFDPVVWYRPRAERLFNFHYRIEIYVPAKKRKWGYYVLPFLLDDKIVARVDLKADRKNGALLVLASHPEEGIDHDRAISTLAGELRTLAKWLGLERIKVSRRGLFARGLADFVRDNLDWS